MAEDNAPTKSNSDEGYVGTRGSISRLTHDLELKLGAVDLHGDWIWMPREWAIHSIRLGFRVER